MLGLGGIWVETLKDVALLPAGAGKAAIIEALGRLKGAALLRGARGAPPVDIAAVADIARTVGALLQRSPDIAELEINPLVAYSEGQGALALDALIVKSAALESSAGAQPCRLRSRAGTRIGLVQQEQGVPTGTSREEEPHESIAHLHAPCGARRDRVRSPSNPRRRRATRTARCG